jgi:thermosome
MDRGQEMQVISDRERYSDEDAQRMNILAARAVAEAIKSTLGPKGMDKMLVVSKEEIALTDSGVTILSMIRIKHPAAKMIVEIAKTQAKEAGDGTTTAVVLAGEFLKKAEELLDQGIHPTHITQGYKTASEKSMQILKDIAIDITDEDLRNIASTTLMGKVGEEDREHLVNIAVEAMKIAKEKDNIRIDYRTGGKIRDTELIRGIAIDLGKRVRPDMPRRIEGAKILLIDSEFDVKKVEHAKIELKDPRMMRAFATYKEKVFKIAVDMITKAGANVVLCQKNIDDLAMYYLAKAGILGVRDVEKDVLEKLAKATGGKIVSNVHDVTSDILGYAGLVEETKIGLEEMMYVRECKDPKAVGILIRGGSEKIAMEIKRKMEDVVAVLSRVLKDRVVVTGGGATEIETAKRLRSFARKVSGKEQLAIEAFADALEVIPKTLSANAGLDPIDIIVELRARHGDGYKIGLDTTDGKVKDAYKQGIIEPYRVKKQAIQSASEVANMILRIDDVLLAKGFGKERAMPRMPPSPTVPEGPVLPTKEGKLDLGAFAR